MIHLVTGYAGYEHIQSEDEGAYNAAFFGGGQYVMEEGNQFEGSILDNNTVRILDGNLLMYGRHVRIPRDTYEDVIIQTGTAGKNRIDLICMTYAKNENDGTETCYLQVIRGSETEGTAVVPVYTDGNILEGAVLNHMPLYKVVIEGVVLKEIVPMFTTIPTYKALAEKYAAQFEATIKALKAADILDTMEEIEANENENMFAGALAVKEGFDGINSDMEWKYLGQTAGSNTIAFPPKFRELRVVVPIETNFEYAHSILITKEEIDKGLKNFYAGFYFNATSNGGTRVDTYNNQLKVGTLYFGGANKLDNAQMKVYYR